MLAGLCGFVIAQREILYMLILFIVLLLCLVDSFQHRSHLVGEEGADSFPFFGLPGILSPFVCFSLGVIYKL